MVTQINAVFQLIRFMAKRWNGAAWEAKFVGNGNMLVISQPSTLKTRDGSPVMCSTCNRINDALLLPERNLDIPKAFAAIAAEHGARCICNMPRFAIGSKHCLLCNLPVNLRVLPPMGTNA